MKFTLIAGVSLALAGHVAAWGPMGHQAVGYIAMEFLAPNAAAFVKKTIPDSFNNSLGPAATWPDDVRRSPEYKWSAPFHFLDTKGKPWCYCVCRTSLHFDVVDDPKGGSCLVVASNCGRQGCLCEVLTLLNRKII